MGLQVNTNISALNAQRNLQNVTDLIGGSVERLSSGLRINRGADDPAGLIISEGLRAQITGLNQAISNSQDAANLIKTAEGGLNEVNTLLRNIRQLALHAANTGVNDINAVQADQTGVKSAIDSIQRIATQTQFGSKRLLDGTSGVTSAVSDTKDVAGINFTSTFGGYSVQGGTVNITVNNVATRAVVSGVGTSATYASVNASLSAVSGGTAGNGGTVVINGQTVVAAGSDTVQTLINKINSVSAATGVTADFTFVNGSGAVVLSQQSYGSNFSIVQSESATLLSGSTNGTTVSGKNATVTVYASVLVNGATSQVSVTFSGGRYTSDTGLRLTDTAGNSILLTEAGNNAGLSQQTVGSITANSVQFQIGANSAQTVSTSLGNIQTVYLGNTAVSGSNLSLVDVTTTTGANNALQIVDQSIQQIATLRGSLGAFQKNVLEVTTRYLGISAENVSASESQIRDTNIASETVAFTKNQIIQQAATSVLAQANASPREVLSLLR